MPRRRSEPDPDDDFDGDDLPDGVYHDAGEIATVSCPYCQELVPEDAQFCGRCENYISKEDAPADRKPLWIWICLALALLTSVLAAF